MIDTAAQQKRAAADALRAKLDVALTGDALKIASDASKAQSFLAWVKTNHPAVHAAALEQYKAAIALAGMDAVPQVLAQVVERVELLQPGLAAQWANRRSGLIAFGVGFFGYLIWRATR